MTRKARVKKLTIKDRQEIKKLAETKITTYEKIAKMFNISKSRVSQIVNDNYNESEFTEGNTCED